MASTRLLRWSAQNCARSMGGGYPYQIRVALSSKELVAIPRRSLEKLVVGDGRVVNILTGGRAQDVYQFYASSYTAVQERAVDNTKLYEDYRNRYPAEYRCTDGHPVRSKSEQLIDEWLYRHHIAHGYEELPNLPERLIPDFTLHFPDAPPILLNSGGYWATHTITSNASANAKPMFGMGVGSLNFTRTI